MFRGRFHQTSCSLFFMIERIEQQVEWLLACFVFKFKCCWKADDVLLLLLLTKASFRCFFLIDNRCQDKRLGRRRRKRCWWRRKKERKRERILFLPISRSRFSRATLRRQNSALELELGPGVPVRTSPKIALSRWANKMFSVDKINVNNLLCRSIFLISLNKYFVKFC